MPFNEPITYSQDGVPSGDFQGFLNYVEGSVQHASFGGQTVDTSTVNRPVVGENVGGEVVYHNFGIKPPLLGPTITTSAGSFTGELQIAVQRVAKPNQAGECRSGISPIFPGGTTVDAIRTVPAPSNSVQTLLNTASSIAIAKAGPNYAVGQKLQLKNDGQDYSVLTAVGGQLQNTSTYYINKLRLWMFRDTPVELEGSQQVVVKIGLYKAENYTNALIPVSSVVTLDSTGIPTSGGSALVDVAFPEPAAIAADDLANIRIIISMDTQNSSDGATVYLFYDPNVDIAISGQEFMWYSTSTSWQAGTGWVTSANGTGISTLAQSTSPFDHDRFLVTTQFGSFGNAVMATGSDDFIYYTKCPPTRDDQAVTFATRRSDLSDFAKAESLPVVRPSFSLSDPTDLGTGLVFVDPSDSNISYAISPYGYTAGVITFRVAKYVGALLDATFNSGNNVLFDLPSGYTLIDVDPNGLYLLAGDSTSFVVLASSSGYTVWTQTAYTPASPRNTLACMIRALPGTPTTVFVAGNAGVDRSTNSGVSFSQVLAAAYPGSFYQRVPTNLRLIGKEVAIELAGTNGYFVGKSGDNAVVYKSTDSGATWGSPVTVGPFGGRNIASCSQSTVDTSSVFVLAGNSVYLSTDGGATFATSGSNASRLSYVFASPSVAGEFYLAGAIISTKYFGEYSGGGGYEISSRGLVTENRFTPDVAPQLYYSVARTVRQDQNQIELSVARFANKAINIDTAAMYFNEPESEEQGGSERYTHFAILFRDFNLGSEWRQAAIVPAGQAVTFDAQRSALAGFPTYIPEFYEVPGGFDDVETYRSQAGERLCFIGQTGFNFFDGIPGSKDYQTRIYQPFISGGGEPVLTGKRLATINEVDSMAKTIIVTFEGDEEVGLLPFQDPLIFLTTSGNGGVISIVGANEDADGRWTLNYEQAIPTIEPFGGLFLGYGAPAEFGTVFSVAPPSGPEAAGYGPGFQQVSLIDIDISLFQIVQSGGFITFRGPNASDVAFAPCFFDPQISETSVIYAEVNLVGGTPTSGWTAHVGLSAIDAITNNGCATYLEASGSTSARSFLQLDSSGNRIGLYNPTVTPFRVVDGAPVTPEYGVRGSNANGTEWCEVRSVCLAAVQNGSSRVRVGGPFADDYWQQRDILFEGDEARGTIKKVVKYDTTPVTILSVVTGPVITVTTATEHGVVTGQKVTVQNGQGLTAFNVVWVATRISDTVIEFTDITMTTLVTGTYVANSATLIKWLTSPELELYSPWAGREHVSDPLYVLGDYTSIYFAGAEPDTKEAVSGLTRFNLSPDASLKIIAAARGSLYVITEKNTYYEVQPSAFLVPRTEGELNDVFIDIQAQVRSIKQTAVFSCSSANYAVDSDGRLYFGSPQGIYRISTPRVELIAGMRERFAKYDTTTYKRMALAFDAGIFPASMLRIAALSFEENETFEQMAFSPEFERWLSFRGFGKIDALCPVIARDGSARILIAGNGRIGVCGATNTQKDFTPWVSDTKGNNVFSMGRYRGDQYSGFVKGSQIELFDTDDTDASKVIYRIDARWRYQVPIDLDATPTQPITLAIESSLDPTAYRIETDDQLTLKPIDRVQIAEVEEVPALNNTFGTSRINNFSFDLVDGPNYTDDVASEGIFAPDVRSTIEKWGSVYNTPRNASDIPHIPARSGIKLVLWNNETGESQECEIIGRDSSNRIYVYRDNGPLTIDNDALYYWALGPRPWRVDLPERRPITDNKSGKEYSFVYIKRVDLDLAPRGSKTSPFWIKMKVYGAWKNGQTDYDNPTLERIISWERFKDMRFKIMLQTRKFRSVGLTFEGYHPVDSQLSIKEIRVTYDYGMGG